MSKPLQTSDIHFGAFIALMALLVSLMALSVDIILPALPPVGQDLQIPQSNDNQLIIVQCQAGDQIWYA